MSGGHMGEIAARHRLPHATWGDDPSGHCGCSDCEPIATCGCNPCRVAAAGGLGAVWECDNCKATVEIGLDDEPAGWLIEEPDEDDYPEGEEVPIDLILCADCRIPPVYSPVKADPK